MLFHFFRNKQTKKQNQAFQPSREEPFIPISKSLKENEQQITTILHNNPDMFKRSFQIKFEKDGLVNISLFGIDGLIDESAIHSQVIEPLISDPISLKGTIIESVKNKVYLKEIQAVIDLQQAVFSILKGATLLLIDGQSQGILLMAEGYEVRNIEEPSSETVVRGAREGFLESIMSNMALLRRRIPHPNLIYESINIGKFSKTRITLAYMNGIVDPNLVKRIKQKLNQIKVDDISSSGQIEQYLEDNPYSLFATTGNTERPDKAAAVLMEGRALVFVDGSPTVLYYPYFFLESMHSVEDYSSRPFYVSFIRITRLIAFLLSVFLPALYLSAVNVHKNMIPGDLILTISKAREGVPFPLTLELLVMVFLFEVVREAGIRMPRAVGQAVSIVGALILGDVSVSAGLIGAPTIIIVAISSIAAFIITPVADVAAMLRILYIFPASLFGIYGLIIAVLWTTTHMVTLTSMGVAYMSPFAPFHFPDWKDTLIRLPYRLLRKRPVSIPNMREIRYKQVPQKKGEQKS